MTPRQRIWIVVRPNGEHYFIEKEPLEGLHEWAAGQEVTVLEYTFTRVAYSKAPADVP